MELSHLIQAGKLKLQEEYKEKEKKLISDERVSQSTADGKSRTRKMEARDVLLNRLVQNCTEKLKRISSSPEYPTLLKDLIVQGLIKIEEQTVEIQCRAEDKSAVTRAIVDAVSEYRSLMTAAGHRVNPKVTLSKTPIDPRGGECAGGVILTALDGRIVLNQTLDERLSIAYQAMMPKVRMDLFSTSIDGIRNGENKKA
jgi:V-type H+-transporting ATPase subunit E